MLIYIISLTLRSTVDMVIDNQCSNVRLTSLVYFTKDATCHIRFPQQVDSKSMMEVNFRTGLDRSKFGGALLYYLQREDNETGNRSNTDKDASTSTQLLVIWGFNSDEEPYFCACLIEHDNTLVWNEDKLKRLYHIYDSQNNIELVFDWEGWLLDDNTKLQTVRESSYKRGFKRKITISEEKDLLSPRKPLWINPSR
jgi:hypothetical protein